MKFVFDCETDCTVKLVRSRRNFRRRFPGASLCCRDRPALRLFDGQVSGRPGSNYFFGDDGELMLNRLKVTDWAAELNPRGGKFNAQFKCSLECADDGDCTCQRTSFLESQGANCC